MEYQSRVQPFGTIESAQEFVALLHTSISETLADIEPELYAALSRQAPRRAEALELVIFKLRQLRSCVITTEKLLKDLCTLRDLLSKDPNERGLTRNAAAAESFETLGVG